MGILDSIVEWLATQVMNLLDMINGSVLGALGCDMSVFLRYFPAANTLYEVFVATAIGFIQCGRSSQARNSFRTLYPSGILRR